MNSVYLLVCCLISFLVASECLAQTPNTSPTDETIVASKLVVPSYPTMARIARVEGDLNLTLDIGPDGHVQSALVVSGPALRELRQAALESARSSQFECRGCSKQVTYSLRYSYKIIVHDPPKTLRDCNTQWQVAPPPAEVDVPQHQVTIFAWSPPWTCDPAVRRIRSAKCLYLWKCGSREEPD